MGSGLALSNRPPSAHFTARLIVFYWTPKWRAMAGKLYAHNDKMWQYKT
jgi:hypothetical protein